MYLQAMLQKRKRRFQTWIRQDCKGSIKEPTKQIRLPVYIAKWLKMPGVLTQVRSIMQAYKQI